MSERPILFSGEMVRAILDGRKTQTRRIVKPQPEWRDVAGVFPSFVFKNWLMPNANCEVVKLCPYGSPGDRLWVRETWREDSPDDPERALYRADELTGLPPGFKWKPSIFMPRWASRITLELTDVRVERLQDISEGDAKAEGASFSGPRTHEYEDQPTGSYAHGFRDLWDSINAKRAPWASNPWVWRLSFKRLTDDEA